MDQTSTSGSTSKLQWLSRTDVIVVLAMGLVALAFSVALNLHFGLPASRAVIAGLMIYGLLVGAHFLIVPRSKEAPDVAELEDDELWRALKEQRRDGPDATRMAMATRTEIETDSEPSAAEAQPMPPASAHVPRRKPRIRAQVPAPQDPSEVTPVASNAPMTPDAAHPTSMPAGDDTLWSYRPSDDVPSTSQESGVPDTPTLPSSAPAQAPSETGARAPRESDVELVQNMIKKLAHQVNAAEGSERPSVASAPETATAQRTASESEARSGPQQPPAIPVQVQQPQAAPEAPHAGGVTPPSSPADVDVVKASVGALRSTAHAMREADAAAPEGAPQVDQPLRTAPDPVAASLGEQVQGALSAGQFGVLLEPILTLNGMRPDHYEVSLQVHTDAGARLNESDAETAFQASGALPQVDRERFIRTLSVGELLGERGKTGSILTRIYRESLLDRDFCFAVATSGVANETLAQRIVLSLTQEAVRSLTASEWQTLNEFRELGYRFAVSDVSDLEMDFSQLTAAGFTFVKLDAELFVDGLSDGQGTIAPADLCRYLSHVGLGVIVDGLDDSETVARVVALGASLGQGQVSGGARLMKAKAVNSDGHAAA